MHDHISSFRLLIKFRKRNMSGSSVFHSNSVFFLTISFKYIHLYLFCFTHVCMYMYVCLYVYVDVNYYELLIFFLFQLSFHFSSFFSSFILDFSGLFLLRLFVFRFRIKIRSKFSAFQTISLHIICFPLITLGSPRS